MEPENEESSDGPAEVVLVPEPELPVTNPPAAVIMIEATPGPARIFKTSATTKRCRSCCIYESRLQGGS